MSEPSDLARLRQLDFQEQLIAWLQEAQGPQSGSFGEGVHNGIHAAIRQLPRALDALLPGTLPVPYSAGCGCGPGEVCPPPGEPDGS